MKSKIVESRKHSDSIHFIKCLRNEMAFEPGNCVDITNSRSDVRKPYSIASSPGDEHLAFYVRVFESKTGVSKYISTLKEGDEIEISDSPFGYFSPGKDQENRKYVYIATGTGLAPFLSALGHYPHKPYMILYGVRHTADILEPAMMSHRFLAVSREVVASCPKHVSGDFDRLPTDKPDDFTYYVCGLEEMIADTTQYLIQHGVSWDKIQVEQFYYTQY
jgi:ferredoxin-NADP reductase